MDKNVKEISKSKNPFKDKSNYDKLFKTIETILNKFNTEVESERYEKVKLEFEKVIDKSEDPIELHKWAIILNDMQYSDFAILFLNKASSLGYELKTENKEIDMINDDILNQLIGKTIQYYWSGETDNTQMTINKIEKLENDKYAIYYNDMDDFDIVTEQDIYDLYDRGETRNELNKMVLNESVVSSFDLASEIADDLLPQLKEIKAQTGKFTVEDLENFMSERGADLEMIDEVVAELVDRDFDFDIETEEYIEDLNENILSIKFNDIEEFNTALTWFESTSEFTPDYVNKEFMTIDFEVERDEKDSLENYLENELQNTQLTSWSFISETLQGGLADNMTIDDIAAKHGVGIVMIENQLEKGIKVEMEHTSDENVAKEIAMDHLVELPDYYDRLETIEQSQEYKTYFNDMLNTFNVESPKDLSKEQWNEIDAGWLSKSEINEDHLKTRKDKIDYINFYTGKEKSELEELSDDVLDTLYLELESQNKIDEKLRTVKVVFSNDETITTNMAEHLTDEEIYQYYEIGKPFNLGTIEDDIQTVKDVIILENYKQVLPMASENQPWKLYDMPEPEKEELPYTSISNMINNDSFMRYAYSNLMTGRFYDDMTEMYNKYIKNDEDKLKTLSLYEAYTINENKKLIESNKIGQVILETLNKLDIELSDKIVNTIAESINNISNLRNSYKTHYNLLSTDARYIIKESFKFLSLDSLVERFRTHQITLDNISDMNIFESNKNVLEALKTTISKTIPLYESLDPEIGSVLAVISAGIVLY